MSARDNALECQRQDESSRSHQRQLRRARNRDHRRIHQADACQQQGHEMPKARRLRHHVSPMM